MKNYTDIYDIKDISTALHSIKEIKSHPFKNKSSGKNKTLLLLFFNSSLRTRLSSEIAARNLGLDVKVLNVDQAWNLEFQDGTIMNLEKAEHIKEAAQVLSEYVDMIGIRAFPGLKDKVLDESEPVISAFIKYASVPIINLESATAHPLQALTDAFTIWENKAVDQPKVVLSWAPHPKLLPQAVPNSFVRIMKRMPVELIIAHPKGYELDDRITENIKIEYDQNKAFEQADFIYAKNWSTYEPYGAQLEVKDNWMITAEKLQAAKFMHCLPVRRNVVVEDAVLDGPNSLAIQQAGNRLCCAQYVLSCLL